MRGCDSPARSCYYAALTARDYATIDAPIMPRLARSTCWQTFTTVEPAYSLRVSAYLLPRMLPILQRQPFNAERGGIDARRFD